MANATPTRLGAINGTVGNYANENALFLKVFSGEVLTAFANKTVTADKHMVRTITSGKSAQFPRTGRTGAGYHTPGAEIVGRIIKGNEKIITINDLLLSDIFISNIDEAKNHYDVRSIYSSEMGIALANQMDKHVLQTFIQAALVTTPDITGESDMVGTVIDNAYLGGSANMATNVDDLIAAIFEAAEALDVKNVPEEGRNIFVKPDTYYRLANSSKVIHGDFGNAGNGSTASGKVFRVAGMPIVKTNNLPSSNITTGVEAGSENRQAVDARNTVAVIAHPSAVGTVKLMDLSTEMEWDIRRQGTLMVAKYAVGHGVLRPEASVLLRTATPV
ncbi:phage capsid protein [Hyphomicrobium sp. ghe19]|uniref:phage capsid protein n=1 Tax=Hyphomicrobium sp. ghe19 TaxID=2682968 RepID=UPI0030CB90B9